MKKKKLLFILNPLSGKGHIKNKLLEIIDIFVKYGYEVTVYSTQKPQDATEVVRECDGKYHLVVCCGGDGTLNETVSGMMEREKKMPVGFIPSGSTNDFAASLKIPSNMGKAAQVAVKGTRFACDIGMFNDRYFVYIAAFGLFTDVSYATSQDLKNRLGHTAYLLEGVKRLHAIKSYHLQISYDGKFIDDKFIYGMVTNSMSAGGFKNITGKNVMLDDGLFEVTLIRMPKTPLELNEIIRSLTNLIDDTELIYTFKTDSMNIKCAEEIPWTLDGEYGGSHVDIVIKNEKQAVEVMVPKENAGK